MATIVSQIEDIEKIIKASEDEMDMIDRSLRLRKLSDDESHEKRKPINLKNSAEQTTTQREVQLEKFYGEDLENQMKHMKEKIKELEKDLGTLRKENRKSMAVSVAILALFFLVYIVLIS